MIGRDIYRLAIDHWRELIQNTTSWPDRLGHEREPFTETPYRNDLENEVGYPAAALNRRFQVLADPPRRRDGGSNTIAGAARDRTLPFSVNVAYLLGGGDEADEQEVRTLAAQDCEAIVQSLMNPLNFKKWADDAGNQTGIIDVQADAPGLNSGEDRLVLSIPFEAHMRVLIEPAEGAAA